MDITRIDLVGVNCYLADTGEGFILFDTGGHLAMDRAYDDRRAALSSALENAGCAPGKLKLIVLTHGDCDHTANAAYLREQYGAPIAIHPGDASLVTTPEMDEIMKTFHYRPLALKIACFFMKKTLRRVTEKIYRDFTPFTPDVLLQDGDSLEAYGLDAAVVHLPGHSPGSIGIVTADGDLIAGDTFAHMKKPVIALNAVDFTALKASVTKIKAMDIGTVYPGHGKPFRMAEMRG
jgi:hydroxyacylglutathione hydrolase